MTRLILGCGYLGRRVAALWRAAGHEVAALTRSPARAEELRALGIVPIVGDVLDVPSLRALPDCETVLWAVGFDRSSGRTQREVTVDGVRNVAGELFPRCRRWIQISSTSVYGQDAGEWVDEESDCRPSQPGGQANLDAENLLRELSSHRLAPSLQILRLSGIYGPARLLRRVSEVTSGAPLAGNPEAWLNLIHGDDAARVVLACEQRGAAGATYLVSDDRPIARREYYSLLAQLLGAAPPRFDAPSPVDSNVPSTRLGGNKRCANRRMREELGVALEFPTIESGLPHALATPAT